MKKLITLLLTAAMCLSIAACGDSSSASNPSQDDTYNFGDSITTKSGKFVFTPTFGGFAAALSNCSDENYLLPDGKGLEKSTNPYAADEGKVMMYFSAQVEYIGDSKETETFSFEAELNYDEGYLFSIDGIGYSSNGEDWDPNYDETSFEPLSSDTVHAVRFCIEVPEVVATDFEKRTVVIFTIENKEYTFVVDVQTAAEEKAEREAAAEAERIEKMTEVDTTLAKEIREKLQGTWSWSTAGYAGEFYTVTHSLTFSGDIVSVQTQNTLLNTTMSNIGTYYVAKGYIVLYFVDGSQACMPYTYEDGTLNISQEFEGAFYTA